MPLQIIRQDITKMQVDAIVNTTNEKMVGYSGVDLAVHQGAGPLLRQECARLVPLGLGTAKLTRGYNLAAKYIIHTSGPVWRGGLVGESIILKSCYLESLELAVKYGCDSVAFPLISSGEYGYPKDQVLKFAVQVITEFLLDHELMVYLCVFDRKSYEFSQTLYAEISDFIDDHAGKCEEDFIKEPVTYNDSTRYSIAEESYEKGKKAGILKKYSVRKSAVRSRYDIDEKSVGPHAPLTGAANKTLGEYMKDMDKSFAYKLFNLIDARNMTDVECYKKANIDKKTFSKIKCNPDTYRPSKQTAVAFAIALKLNLEETQDLLASAGLTLSRSFTFDKIIMYFIQKEIYDIFEINEALFEFDQVLLGC